jgi:hypothetical protein
MCGDRLKALEFILENAEPLRRPFNRNDRVRLTLKTERLTALPAPRERADRVLTLIDLPSGMSKEDNSELWLQFGPRRVGCIRGNDQAREMCDSYNGARYFRRDGVMAAWLVDPQTKQVIHGNAPPGWETFDR